MKTNFALVLAGAVSLAAAGWRCSQPTGEPCWDGITLTTWLTEHNERAYRLAVREMGTNALPWLVRLTNSPDQKLRQAAQIYLYGLDRQNNHARRSH